MTTPPPPPGYPPPGYPINKHQMHAVVARDGIVAIVKSSQVNGLWAQGRFAEAQASADSAKKWVTWAVVVGLIVNVIYIGVYVANMNSDTNAAAAMLFSAL